MGKTQNKFSGGDWDDRILCSDEACIGTIGSDGRCRVCGLSGKNQPVAAAVTNEDEPAQATTIRREQPSYRGGEPTDAEDQAVPAAREDGARPTNTNWEERIPCRDESCIGTIGTDGLCRECGLAYDD